MVGFNYVAEWNFGISADLSTVNRLVILGAFAIFATYVYLCSILIAGGWAGIEIIIMAATSLTTVLVT